MITSRLLPLSVIFILCHPLVQCGVIQNSTLANLTLSEGDTYRLECGRPSTDYTFQFVKFNLFLDFRPGTGSTSSSWLGPFVLSTEDVLDVDIQPDSRYHVERKSDLEFVLKLKGVQWQDQATFGCRAYQNYTNGNERNTEQRVVIPGPITGLQLVLDNDPDLSKATPITEEIRVRDQVSFKKFACQVNTTNTVPPDGFDIQLNGESIRNRGRKDPSVYTHSVIAQSKRYGDNTYAVLSYTFDEFKRYKDKKSVYTCKVPKPDGGEFSDNFTVALEYEPEYKNGDCTQTREKILSSGLFTYTITCRVMAFPFATPLWSAGADFINETATLGKYETYYDGPYHDAKYYLRITNVTDEDFGIDIKFQAINIVNFSPQQWITLDENAPYTGSANTVSNTITSVILLQCIVLVLTHLL